MDMTAPDGQPAGETMPTPAPQVVVVGPDGALVDPPAAAVGAAEAEPAAVAAAQVSAPDKVMRIGTMVKQLLDEVRTAPLDERSRVRLRDVHRQSITELSDGLSPELRDELGRLALPFGEDEVPSDAELRIAQAQLVGWLEGVFHGIQAALVAQQVTAQLAQQQGRGRPQLPAGAGIQTPAAAGTGQYL